MHCLYQKQSLRCQYWPWICLFPGDLLDCVVNETISAIFLNLPKQISERFLIGKFIFFWFVHVASTTGNSVFSPRTLWERSNLLADVLLFSDMPGFICYKAHSQTYEKIILKRQINTKSLQSFFLSFFTLRASNDASWFIALYKFHEYHNERFQAFPISRAEFMF